ncbi:hypothetical protein HMPREF0063_12429 [Aeromicrobium marinum DSM 15272]|uniref:Uncharacterized protein n=1 Tax=Aeromicrobium marinum DSM 15272 TaxID=585531 RepID=E2SEH0_9ACTN|nr:hypothetical protein [Aeromicrobium marinum]EFQ82447.1 hypothetical protein HMPREF0063_12429 [Aeromicrobium marinum DSM 15272]
MSAHAAEPAPTFEIHRRVRLYLVLGLCCVVLAAGFGAMAYDQRDPVLAAPAAVFLVLALALLRGTGDASTPLFIADDHGVRMRNGDGWIGLLWNEMGEIRVEAREGWRHDARVKVVSADGLRVYSTPLGLSTTVAPAEARTQLAQRRGAVAY